MKLHLPMPDVLPEPTGWLILLCAWLAVARVQGVSPAPAEHAACVILRVMPFLTHVHLPVIFLVVALLLSPAPAIWIGLIAALFAFGHVFHACLRACPGKTRLRGQVYCVNLVAVLLLLAAAVVRALGFLVGAIA
jgi:hypothetical protein